MEAVEPQSPWTDPSYVHVEHFKDDTQQLKSLRKETSAGLAEKRHRKLFIQGGIIRKKAQWRVKFKAYLLAVEDPSQPGKDIAAGTYNISAVRALLHLTSRLWL